jgi:hypothetical protein
MKILIYALALFVAISCSDFECSNIKDAVDVRCVQGEFKRDAAFWNCFNEETVNCDKTAICINQNVGCDLELIEACLNGYKKCDPVSCGTPAVLDCPESEYYHPDPDDPEAGSRYFLSEAFAGCLDYRLDFEQGASHVWICQEGVCIPPEEIETTICPTDPLE